jgi:cold shock CspA family protein
MCVEISEIFDEFGIVVALRDAFGFLQPLQKEEQIYFSLRDVKSEVVVGDLVRYKERTGVKGLSADQIRVVPGSGQISLSGAVVGTVCREPDVNRRIPGLVNVSSHTVVDGSGYKLPLPNQIPFIPGPCDVLLSSRSAPMLPNSSSSSKGGLKRIIKGDEVQFECFHIPGSNYLQGHEARVTRTKKEMQFALQIQRMLDAGAVQEAGIVDALKGDYGFIKPRDRKEQIYFRVSDMIDQEVNVESVSS